MAALAKDRHYWTQLRSALTAGQWSSPTPAKTPKGIALSWSELFRKFNKHVKGFTEVTQIVSQTRTLALLLEADSREAGFEGSRSDGCLALGDECTLLEEHIPEAREGLELLMKLETSQLTSVYLTLSFYVYALGRPSECLSYLEKVPNLLDFRNHIPTNAAATSRPNTASTLQIHGVSGTTSLASAESSASVTDVNDGMAWAITETIRSLCLQGMSYEKLFSNEPRKALNVYSTALPILSIVESGIPCVLPATGTGKLDFSSFTRFHELWLWVERLLRRAIVLASRTCVLNPAQGQNEDSNLLWALFSHYRTCSIYWPTKFKTEQRSTVAVLHLRALILRARILSSNSPDRSSLDADKPPPAWLSDARSVINEYRAILNICTRFPKAGERNTKVEDFVDLCVAVWEAGGAIGDHTSWVIDILWWATRLTFNSFKIYRHMTRIFYISGDPQLARRTLRLYVQVVGKAWEAGVGVDADTDQHWVETLTHGARMLCRLAGPSGIDDAREAGELIGNAKTRLDKDNKELVASVNLGEGIWSSVMALVEYDSRTRPARLAHALAQFAASIETFPTPSAYYHLAIALARPGPQQDLDQAVASASTAVEGASGDIRFWHLLGLLLTANGQWSKARGVFEIAAGIGESEDDVTEERGDNGTNLQVHGFESKTGGTSGHEHNGLVVHPSQPVFILEFHSEVIPPSAALLQPVPDYPISSWQDMFEYALQLRMSQLALAEHVEGAEGAALRWVEVFGWVADRKGVVSEQQRSSIDTARASEEIRQFSEYIHTNVQALEGGNQVAHSSEKRGSSGHRILNGVDEETQEPPPIFVTPASPATPDTPDINSGEKRSTSIDQDSSKGKKVQQMLKNRVHKSQARISTISRKIGHGMVKNSSVVSLRRTTSAPDFHTLLQHNPYQASSIHSRRRLSFIRYQEPSPSSSPPPPPPALSPGRQDTKRNTRMAKENRLLSDLWLMSAATFRRLGKIEQAKGAIQEGEVKDEDNPAVWVQLGLYYTALGHDRHAIDAFHKALFIAPDDISATVHLCRVYLSPSRTSNSNQVQNAEGIHLDNVDLAAGMLSHSVEGAAWDVPEAWYFLAKAYALQGRKDKEWKALTLALSLSEHRSIRDIGLAVGWCL